MGTFIYSPCLPSISEISNHILSLTLWSLYLACENCHNEGCPANSSNSSSSFAENASAIMQHTLTAPIKAHDRDYIHPVAVRRTIIEGMLSSHAAVEMIA